jgi:putative transposase
MCPTNPPGKTNPHAFTEQFNQTFHHEVLDASVLVSLHQVREITAEWLREYNDDRPHDMLEPMPPFQFTTQRHQGHFS